MSLIARAINSYLSRFGCQLILGICFVLIFVLDAALLYAVVEGAPLIEAANVQFTESACQDYYAAREINQYYLQGGFGGGLIYFFNLIAPLWLLGSMIVATILTLSWQTRWYLRGMPFLLMLALVATLVSYLPVVWAISCAIE